MKKKTNSYDHAVFLRLDFNQWWRLKRASNIEGKSIQQILRELIDKSKIGGTFSEK